MIKIGIDPDLDKSGVAYLENEKLDLFNLSFFELFTYLDLISDDEELNVKIYIECGFLNKSNWHKHKGSLASNMETSRRTGENHQVAKKICEMCEYLGIDYEQIKPTKAKLKADIFNKITGHKGRSNQEQRDAAMLVWGK